ncbi:hypothetical protein [Streptomyces sp. NPDC058202]|uniref:hypothetical protein n=1 Tax=Streptomyces sp. NPDC058202 TaxID=3346380 RepID=UPI0036EB7B55
MEIAQLVLAYLKVCVWPGVVLAVVFGFKDELAKLLHRLRRFSGLGFDAELSEEIVDATTEVDAALRDAEVGRQAARHELSFEERRVVIDPLVSAAYTDPIAGIVAAWREIELTLYEMTEASQEGRPMNMQRLIDSLDGLPTPVKDSLHRLRRLRNEAVHAGRGEAPSAESAVDYVSSCRNMAIWLRTYGTD